MKVIQNPWRGSGLTISALESIPQPSTDAKRPASLVSRCPRHGQTPLLSADELAREVGAAAVWLKDERDRMGLGSFKALGAAYVIARDAEDGVAAGRTYVTASAGNHGLSVAAGAQAFGALAEIHLSSQVPESFAKRLTSWGARVVRSGETYEESMDAAAASAEEHGAILLSDSSWPGYVERPHTLMEGYLVLVDEMIAQVPNTPTHILLQAGVGGLAGACAALARARWGDAPVIAVVEPEVAPALAASIEAGHPVTTSGPVSEMGRLDCKEPSLIALKGLARDADLFVTISEDEGRTGADRLAKHGFATTPSGGAGVSAVIADGASLGIGPASRVLAILSEQADDA